MTTEITKPPQDVLEEQIASLRQKRAKVELGGGKERIDKQHASRKLTAREQIGRAHV